MKTRQVDKLHIVDVHGQKTLREAIEEKLKDVGKPTKRFDFGDWFRVRKVITSPGKNKIVSPEQKKIQRKKDAPLLSETKTRRSIFSTGRGDFGSQKSIDKHLGKNTRPQSGLKKKLCITQNSEQHVDQALSPLMSEPNMRGLSIESKSSYQVLNNPIKNNRSVVTEPKPTPIVRSNTLIKNVQPKIGTDRSAVKASICKTSAKDTERVFFGTVNSIHGNGKSDRSSTQRQYLNLNKTQTTQALIPRNTKQIPSTKGPGFVKMVFDRRKGSNLSSSSQIDYATDPSSTSRTAVGKHFISAGSGGFFKASLLLDRESELGIVDSARYVEIDGRVQKMFIDIDCKEQIRPKPALTKSRVPPKGPLILPNPSSIPLPSVEKPSATQLMPFSPPKFKPAAVACFADHPARRDHQFPFILPNTTETCRPATNPVEDVRQMDCPNAPASVCIMFNNQRMNFCKSIHKRQDLHICEVMDRIPRTEFFRPTFHSTQQRETSKTMRSSSSTDRPTLRSCLKPTIQGFTKSTSQATTRRAVSFLN